MFIFGIKSANSLPNISLNIILFNRLNFNVLFEIFIVLRQSSLNSTDHIDKLITWTEHRSKYLPCMSH